jgi:hypothetical protein
VGRGLPAKKTDYGTIIFHWALAASIVVAVATGLRIATETPGREWLNVFDFFLPKAAVWTEHLQSAMLLTGISVAYVVYVWRARLWPRLRLDRVRLRGLFGRRYARWGAINIALYWLLFLVLVMQVTTGILLWLVSAGGLIVQMHWFGMWFILGYIVLHIFAQWRHGGAAQLMRIFRPGCLVAPPPPFDIGEILAMLDEQISQRPAPRQAPLAHALSPSHGSARQFVVAGDVNDIVRGPHLKASGPATESRTARRASPSGTSNKGSMFQLMPFAVACAAAGLTMIFMTTSERQAIDTLYIYRVDQSAVPIIDGETSDPVWRTIPALYVPTEHGGNFDGTGETTVSIRAVHDGSRAYFLFIWDDPTRSLKQLPLRKSGAGWQLLHDGYEIGDEHAYNEDKFAALLTRLHTILAGDTTFHAGAAPLSDEPAVRSGQGLHYTMQDGLFADVWEWKATSTNASHHCDDDYFGPPAKATPAQQAGLAPYRGGFAPDPGTANYNNNSTTSQPNDYADGVLPRRLPKDFNAMTAALGHIDLDPNHGESEGARWYMTEEETVPYSPERDRLIPDGAVIPGVVISGQYSGDRADVECAGRWAAGRWALEITRSLAVQSAYDVPISNGTFMRVAAFDHAQIQHTRHVRPIRLELQ